MKPDFDRIKKTRDIASVIESYGVKLKKSGNEHVGLCPFHEETTPSFRVNTVKGVFHCFGCEAKGNVIQFVARKENISDREAALKLCSSIPGIQRGSDLAPPVVTPASLPDSKLFAAALEQYHKELFGRDKRGLDYLKARGLGDEATLRHFKVGLVNGSLKRKLSSAQRVALGSLFNEAGNERFYLRIVVPIFDENARPVGLYGRSIQREAEVKHLYLSGEHRGVWNGAAAAAYPEELIVTEAILDGLALFAAGKKNVISCYGAGGWTEHHDALLEKHAVRKLVFAFDHDEQGDNSSLALAQNLTTRGVRCHRITWPVGIKDAGDYFTYHPESAFRGTAETFSSLLAVAPRLGFIRQEEEAITLAEKNDEYVVFENGSVKYRVKYLSKLSRGGALKIILTARKGASQHVDNLDLYGSKARKMFASTAASRLGCEVGKIEADLLSLVEALENLQAEEAHKAASTQPLQPVMTEEEKAEALSLLRSPDLLSRVAEDIELAGYVGEERNKKLSYLIGTSRRLPKPLSAIFRAQSGSGKSFLMETVAEMMPPEDVHYFSRLTPQALYYLERDALTHKLLIVDERDGSEESEYPIRTLQTRKVLKLAVPVKDPSSGKIKTTILEIHGPIAYMESTTDQQINPENANRCFELYLDESPEQTGAIFAAQRRARSLEGWRHERRKAEALRIHHNAQRLLRSLKVIIPYVELIEFPLAWLRGRRDHDRFLSLIEGVAFLHQHQRNMVEDAEVHYIEANLEDYAIAHDLAHGVFAESAGDLPKAARDFLAQVERLIEQRAEKEGAQVSDIWFTRRSVREVTKLPDHLIKRHMREIEDLEYLQVQRAPQGGSFRYRLLPHKKAPAVLDGLLAPEVLSEKWNKWNKSGNLPKTSFKAR